MTEVKLNRRNFIKLGAASASFFALSGSSPLRVNYLQRSTPNIVYIITDQQHFNTISSLGNHNISTPAQDYLSNRGISFENSYCTNPICSPARSSLFTGRMPSETGVWKNGSAIDESIPNIGQWLRENSNYETYYAGKWHLPNGFTFKVPGFDVLTPGVASQGILGDSMTASACTNFLKNRKSKNPFMLVVSFLQPHDICQWLRLNEYKSDNVGFNEPLPHLPKNFDPPNDEPEPMNKLRKEYEPYRANWTEIQWRYYLYNYYRMVEMVDSEIERVITALNDSGFAENTLVIFTSDHGEGMAHHQYVRKNTLYDEAAKVPFIAAFQGGIEANTRSNKLVSGLDIMPTICDYAGIKNPDKVKGKSLRPLFENSNNEWRDFVVAELSHEKFDFSLNARMIRTENFKYIKFGGDDGEQLFDMKNDPGETANLVNRSSYASQVSEMKVILKDWERNLEPSSNLPNRKVWKN